MYVYILFCNLCFSYLEHMHLDKLDLLLYLLVPDIAYCFVKADGKMYVFNRENESTELTGKWRVLEGSGGGTADVPIEKIKVNGELQTPVNKVVDITVPDAYDDTDIRAELANKADITDILIKAKHLNDIGGSL